MSKHLGKLSGNKFTIKENGEKKTYRVEEKLSNRTREISEDVIEKYTHITRIAYDENNLRVGTIDSERTGYSHVLNTNNK